MSIVTTYQCAFNSKKVDSYPVEVLKRVDRPRVSLTTMRSRGLMNAGVGLCGAAGVTSGSPSRRRWTGSYKNSPSREPLLGWLEI